MLPLGMAMQCFPFRRKFAGFTSLTLVAAAVAIGLSGCASLSPQAADNAVDETAAAATAHAGDVLLIGGATVVSEGLGGTHFKAIRTAELFSSSTKTFATAASMPNARGGIQAIPFKTGALAHQVLVPGGTSWDGQFNSSNGEVSLLGAAPAAPEIFKASAFHAGASMSPAPGGFYTATALNDGTVLIAGGLHNKTPLHTALIFHPSTGKFTATANNMTAARAMHSATLLANGKVLLAGGITSVNGSTAASGELYDPATRRFTKIVSPMPTGVAGHTATLISGCGCAADGKVLLAGGFVGGGTSTQPALESTQAQTAFYDPAGNSFQAATNLHEPRAFHTATLINGKVHIAGGATGMIELGNGVFTVFSGGTMRQSIETYNPMTNAVSCVGGGAAGACKKIMKSERAGHSATLFTAGTLKGKVLLAGGNTNASSELYNPAAGTSAATGNLKTARGFHAAVIVP
jgi:hypothetical protein